MANSLGTFQPNTLQWSVQPKLTVDNTAGNPAQFTCTGGRGAHSTTPAAHTAGDRADSVRWAQKQNLMYGYKIPDWVKGQNDETLTFAALANVNTHNRIGPQIQLTVYKT